ncbi:MAG: LytR C-terminal domain-containing protein [Ignavibacteriae bacterium]|nr:LytR C-terminal domain-containing protein [Ignavibacteriota bacterium]
MNERIPPAPLHTLLSRLKRPSSGLWLNIAIGILGVVVLYLSYALIVRMFFAPQVDTLREGDARGRVIQIDVLNGCGVARAGTAMTSYLRSRGYDVVEIRNYHRFDVKRSLVIERTGQMKNAEKVARALGIDRAQIIQQLNPDYYVDVSVVVGQDHASLKHAQ